MNDRPAMFDLHTHHDRCGHARGTLRDYVESALALGCEMIGLSDHSPFFGADVDHAKPWVAMAKSEFPRYVAEAISLRQEYSGRIKVLVGVESDFFIDHRELYRTIYAQYPLDYIIGSVHVLGDTDVFNPARWVNATNDDLRSQYEAYCGMVAMAAKSGMFDIIGHIDVIKATCPEISTIQTPLVDQMLKTLADADAVIEVNTSGKTKPCGGWYPSLSLLERAQHYGVHVTFGSDAHDPFRVGDEFEQVRTHLKAIGYHEWYVFEQRVRTPLPL